MDINLHSVKSLYIRNRLKGSVSFVFTRLRPGGPETGAVELATNLREVLQRPENDPWALGPSPCWKCLLVLSHFHIKNATLNEHFNMKPTMDYDNGITIQISHIFMPVWKSVYNESSI